MHRPTFVPVEIPLRTVPGEEVEYGGACVAGGVGLMGGRKRVGNPQRVAVGFHKVAALGVRFEMQGFDERARVGRVAGLERRNQ